MSQEQKAAQEVAEDDFARMVEWYDLDIEGLDKEDSAAFATLKGAIVREICRGRIVVDAQGFPTVHLKYPVGSVASVTFKHPHGESIIAAGDKKAKNNVTQNFKIISDLSGVPDTIFSRMRHAPDLRNCQHLVTLFLG